ncbi:diacylglycerol kinase [uncultured Desulfuromusa sp.]|uniref:diacylglycerol kinase n=1 Tax=uncultured Desulfuromusa sp. TaxID=219183 RepID=UPI002AA8440A|nr:diacylglycerol kinase [uncultured Desulfuromusa sp.]
MKPTSWLESLNCAIEGILWAAKSERHVRYHFVAALAVVFTALFFKISALEFFLLVLAAVIVIFAELMNTAIEAVVDLITDDYHELAKRAKDVAAGAVLVTSVGAVILGYLVLSGHIFPLFHSEPTFGAEPQGTIPVGALLIVLILVILIKAHYNRGTPLHGGVPSGHAAAAFSIAVSTFLFGESFLIGMMVLLLAVLVSQSRLLMKIHTPREVFLGALLGTVVTLLAYLFFS